ncbi:MAG: hypothetical protein EAZ89_03695 [Bacteroidetes bacterium]|nr:MAG: hypothetical protein EAZ89_03695 [Bacteroidota bacterium]
METVFTELAGRYCGDSERVAALWEEIRSHYGQPSRLYHNLAHLEHVYTQLLDIQPLCADWDSLMFALYYHDVIYEVQRSDNEAQSAELAQERLTSLGFPAEKTARCYAHILATYGHSLSSDPDSNLFTDADLSILGQGWDSYQTYLKQIRQEYAIYPDALYQPGRKKVLSHFLQMDRIYKTQFFYDRLEAQARENLARELASL